MERGAPLEWLDHLGLDRKVNNKTGKNIKVAHRVLTFGLTGSQGQPGQLGLPGIVGPIGLKGKY